MRRWDAEMVRFEFQRVREATDTAGPPFGASKTQHSMPTHGRITTPWSTGSGLRPNQTGSTKMNTHSAMAGLSLKTRPSSLRFGNNDSKTNVRHNDQLCLRIAPETESSDILTVG